MPLMTQIAAVAQRLRASADELDLLALEVDEALNAHSAAGEELEALKQQLLVLCGRGA